MKERNRFITAAAATAAALILLSSCTPNGGSIYATIESAKKTVTSSLAKTLTIQDLVQRALGGPYNVAAGAIYEGAITGSPSTAGDIIQWKTDGGGSLLPIAPPLPGQICSSLVLRSGRLWGAFFKPDNSTFGLYESDAGFSFATSTADAFFAGKQIMNLQVANGYLFAVAGPVTSSDYQYELDYYDGSWHQLIPLQPKMIYGMAWDGTNYWAVGGASQTTVYISTGAVPAAPTVYSLYNFTNGGQLNGVFTDGARVFIPSKSGGVYYNDGITWAQYGPDNQNSYTVGYLCVGGPVGVASKYVVGSDGYGYYYLDVVAGSFTRFNDATILLYSAAVRRILVDTSNNSVFMGTAGGGLWRATFNSGVPDANGWIHE
jgi:hypothetical protein